MVFGEVWVNNAFDTRYMPIACTDGPFAPSASSATWGRRRTFGVAFGVGF